jgi:hypothetical protein
MATLRKNVKTRMLPEMCKKPLTVGDVKASAGENLIFFADNGNM